MDMNFFDLMLKVWHKPFMKSTVLFFAGMVPNSLYLRLVGGGKLHYKMDLRNPQTFNEKLNWMKLFNRNPLYTELADKYAVKRIVSDIIGEEHVVRNLGCWDNFDDIDFDKLPNQFVLKCTHDSSGAIICKDKNTFNKTAAKEKINDSLKLNYYYACREWPYKNIPHRIIADEYLDDHTGEELQDYKFWCFNGKPTYMYCTVKTSKEDIYENFYDMEFNPVNIDHGWPRRDPEFDKPQAFDEMKELAAQLSEGIPFVRVDFFYANNKVYFGEYTFFDWAGLQPFGTYQQDLELGKLIELPQDKIS